MPSAPRTALTGLTWNHPRGIAPLEAVSAEFERRTGIEVGWKARPLHSFEETPLTELVPHCDLIAIDHPFIGDAVASGAIRALDGLLTAEALAERAADSAGWSHASYAWDERQWALGVDAACMVSASRLDAPSAEARIDGWDDVFALARELGPQRVLIAANPTHLWGTFLSLCEAVSPEPVFPEAAQRGADGRPAWWAEEGLDTPTALAALDLVRELLALCSPDSLVTDPIAALDRLASPDPVDYVPLVFGYVTYARADPGGSRVRFADAPGRRGTLTGGVGLAVSAASAHPEEAAAFLEFVTSASVQRGLFSAAGGQPGRRSAWTDPLVNAASGDFFAGTLATMDRSFLRPRMPGYPRFQRAAASRLHELLTTGAGGDAVVGALDRLWEQHVALLR